MKTKTAVLLLCLVPLAACGGDDEELTTPTVTVPDSPATELGIKDLKVGDGAEAKPGDTVTVNYIGVGQQSKTTFDSSYGRAPATFALDQVIPGWTNGIPGMKVGGRRELVIPGDQAYGANPPSPDIAPNETLVFVVDLLAVQ